MGLSEIIGDKIAMSIIPESIMGAVFMLC